LDRAPDSEPKKQRLLDKVTEFEVRLLDANNQWQSLWPAPGSPIEVLPRLVEMKLQIEGVGSIRRLLPGVEGG
jgi:general secretion pathway protein J